MVILKEWKKRQQQAYFILGYIKLSKDQLVFSNTHNSFIQPAKTNDWLKSILHNTDLPYVSTHAFRHTHCSLQFEAGSSIKSVQDCLGPKKLLQKRRRILKAIFQKICVHILPVENF